MKIFDRVPSKIDIPVAVEIELESGEYLQFLDPVFREEGWRKLSDPQFPATFRIVREDG
jgi:hypothetical protein